jgi:16S rRNA (adenine1518-N6/adenine1519-N6)-dimethyltransferase
MKFNHSFKKHYGQNFLKNQKFAAKMVDYLEVDENDTILEIGPGDGMLTKLLLAKGAQVISVEIDYSLLPNLVQKFTGSNFHLVHEDFLKLELRELFGKYKISGKIKVAGSLPYNISKKIISGLIEFNFLNQSYTIDSMCFIVQEEVAQDYVAQAPRGTFLANYVKLLADVKKYESIPANQFFPMPKVNGGILYIKPKEHLESDWREILKLIRIGFVSPRKTAEKNIKSSRKWSEERVASVFSELGIKDKARAAEISPQEWVDMYMKLSMRNEVQ